MGDLHIASCVAYVKPEAAGGVLAVHLAYQHAEPESDLQEPHA